MAALKKGLIVLSWLQEITIKSWFNGWRTRHHGVVVITEGNEICHTTKFIFYKTSKFIFFASIATSYNDPAKARIRNSITSRVKQGDFKMPAFVSSGFKTCVITVDMRKHDKW